MTNKLLNEAIEYAKRGWYVFPCREKPSEPFSKNGEKIVNSEKSPYISNGLYGATRDIDQIKAWWETWPDAMIGINAGKSGLFVVDIDKKHVNGLEEFREWDINDVAGLHSITPSGGMHIVFSGHGKTSTNAKTGIDTRGDKGYFIAPPSRILEGEYTGEYARFDNWERNPGIIPDGLMARLFPEKTIEYVRGNKIDLPDGEKKVLSRSTLEFLAKGAPKGERNRALFSAASDMAGCGYDIEHTKAVTSAICSVIGLSQGEINKTIQSAYSKPRSSAIPDSIQEKLLFSDKRKLASEITPEEQSVMEDAVMACMIEDNKLIPVIADILVYDDFSVIQNRLIFKTIKSMYNIGRKVDYLTLSDEISRQTDKINVLDIQKIIAKYNIDVENAITYAEIIKEKSSLRKLEVVMDNKRFYFSAGNLIDIIAKIEEDVTDIALHSGIKTTNILTSEQAVNMVSERTKKILSGEIEQIKIGFDAYDTHVGGLYSNDFVICAARAGEGKSALALSIANNIAIKYKKPVAFFSLEMSTHETICRLICQLTGLPFNKAYLGKLTKDQWLKYDRAMEQIKTAPLFFDETFGITIPEIRSKIRKLKEMSDIKLVVLDQLEQIKSYEGLKTHLQYDKIAYDIKDLTQEFDIPIILNHQLNRGIADRRLKNPEPLLSDLNQAGEKPANQVWVIRHDKDEQGTIESSRIIMLKNRNGPKITFPVNFVEDRMLFANLAREDEIKYERTHNTKQKYSQNTIPDIDDEGIYFTEEE